ncbi:MAG TPA: S-layer homology domain-containing protein [Chloroflexia bacterium]|nr:S-layer homology domain-containing protein [Chloroflexia bacterium]
MGTRVHPRGPRLGGRAGGRFWGVLGGGSLLLVLSLVLAWRTGAGAAPLAAPGMAPRAGGNAPLDCPSWLVVPSPNGGTADNVLSGVSAISNTAVLAVGAYTDTNGLAQMLIERWNGTQWNMVAPPVAGTGGSTLQAVSARASNDVWAVGQYRPTPGAALQTLTLHWDGSQWSVVASPNAGSLDNHLLGVVAIAANDAWAVGYYTTSLLPFHTLALHWNGTSWSTVSVPNPSFGGALAAVAAVSGSDVWAVGAYAPDLSGNGRTLVIHWTGSSWSTVSSPNTGISTALGAVAVVTAGDIWATGVASDGTRYLTLAEHWNGAAWSIVPSPSFGTGDNGLGGLAVLGTADVWAVGAYKTGTTSQTLAEHWDGTAWTAALSASPSAANNGLVAATVAGTDVWAVGADGPTGQYSTLIERLGSAPCPTATATSTLAPSATSTPTSTALPPTSTPSPPAGTATPPAGSPSPTATGLPATASPGPPSPTPPNPTPGGATATPVPPTATVRPTNTVGPSATPCTLSFTDVHPTDYFYTPVLYLACHGVISGYANGDGTYSFRPYNNTTRAQMVKIVVLGFAKPIVTPAGGNHTFADVPPSQPFFAVIETAAAGNIVSGYTCGGPNEPCDSANRPYFRPYANVTRGQLAKITAAGAGWAIGTPPQVDFADVPAGSAFYVFVEAAYCRGVISGYSCGSPGEPCDAQNRPYFRVVANATRGQIAKIEYGALTGGAACVYPTPQPTQTPMPPGR